MAADLVGFHEAHRRACSRNCGWLEPVGRELDQQSEWILEVDRVHEAVVLDAAVADLALVEPLHGLREDCGARHCKGGRGGRSRCPSRCGADPAGLAPVGEDRDQPARRPDRSRAGTPSHSSRFGLLEDERHAEHALPEIDRRSYGRRRRS